MLSPGWSSYEWRLRYRSYDVTASAARDLGAGVLPRQRVVPRPPRLDRRPRLLRRPARPDRPAGGRLRRRAPAGRGHRRELVGRTVGDARPTTSTTARRSTRGCATTPGCGPAPRPRAGSASTCWTFDVQRLAPYVGPPVVRQETPAPGRDLDLAVGPHAGRLRPEPRRLAPVHRPRRGRAGDHAAARRGARGRRARRPAAAHRAGHRPARAQRRRRLLRADQDVPRLPLRGGHGLAAASSTADSLEAVVVHSELRRTGHFECSDDLLNQLHSNAVWGLRGNFLDVPTDCPATRRAARVDRRPRGLRPVGRLPLRRPRLPPRLARGPRPRAAGPGRAGAVRRPRRPEVRGAPDGVPGSGVGRDLERRGGVGALGAVAGVRRRVGARGPVRLDGRPRAPGRVACCRRRASGTPASSSATGWTRRRHPDRPFEAKADNGVVATACLYRSARHGRRGGGA